MPPKRTIKATTDARKKSKQQAKSKEEEEMGSKLVSCVLHNDTDKEIGRAWELVLRYGNCTTNIPAIAPRGHASIELPKDATEGVLEIQKVGLVFADGANSARVVQGAELRVRVDEADPPLTKEESKKAGGMIRAIIEGSAPIPSSVLYEPPRDSNTYERVPRTSEQEAAYQEMWQWIVKGIGREAAAAREESLKKIRKMIMDGSCFSSERTRFFDVYQIHPRKPVVDGSISVAEIKKALSEDKAKVVVYYRAMDRFPGGNCDSAVVKYTLDFVNEEATAFQWRDWDGSQVFSEEPVSRPELLKKFKKSTIPSILALLEDSSKPTTLSFVSTIDDQSCDSDEYDTEWTSIEVLVYLPQKQAEVSENKPVLHIHQYAVFPNWTTYGFGPTAVAERIEAHPKAQDVLDSLEKVFKMERPEVFSEGNEASENLGKTKDIQSLGYFAPIFLNSK
eukprot:TRINITY_DN4060_c0_g1_i1.p1 TRINITY_DN4060_c0_g1~~TRINITY_DN4060_c0_g1_i1.p1  ORF type:complete len:450 (-),score=125.57 TRINITY_DN4060_c0_g1_i1:29-1378(-)